MLFSSINTKSQYYLFATQKGFLLLLNFQYIFIYFLLEDHSVTERQCAQNSHQRALLSFWLHSWLEQLFQAYDTFYLPPSKHMSIFCFITHQLSCLFLESTEELTSIGKNWHSLQMLTSCKNDISPLNSHREPKWKFQHHA